MSVMSAEIYSTTFIVVVAYVVCVTICAFCQESWSQPARQAGRQHMMSYMYDSLCVCVCALCSMQHFLPCLLVIIVCFLICPRRLSTLSLVCWGRGACTSVFSEIFVRLIALINTNRSMFENPSIVSLHTFGYFVFCISPYRVCVSLHL